MGFDVSFHPVPVEIIQERLLPYVAGQGNIDDLVDDAVRLAKVRHRAKAWGLGVMQLQQDMRARERKGKSKKSKPGWVQKFDSDLHVWGRPFFITADRPDPVSRAIDSYLAAQPDDVDAIAEKMIAHLDPALADQVQPDISGELPDDQQLAQGLRGEMDLFRECFETRSGNKKVKVSSGKSVVANELFQNNFALSLLGFAAHFRPGWMARGHVWPTRLLEEKGLDVKPYFDTAVSLFEPLIQLIPEIAANLEGTITRNYMVGGYIPPDKVCDFRLFLEEHQDKFRDAGRVDFQKILEAVMDAEREHLGFAEASEIYSGALGIMN